jgi:flagellar biosynthetic protein FlhB
MAEPGKTEKATPKKREEAKKRGQVVRSVEINAMLNVLVCLLMLKVTGEYMINGFKNLSAHYWGNLSTLTLTQDTIGSFMFYLITQTTLLILPMLIAVFITGILSNVMQFGFIMTFDPLKPSFDKIDPAKGFKRIFSKRLLFETAKAVIKIAVISYLFYSTVRKIFGDIFMTPLMDIDTYFNFAAASVYKLGMKIVIAFIIFAVIDYLWQRYDYEDNLMMTKQEIKDELKQLEGDPLIKSRIRSIQREMARKRMISEIPQADVVITNPTHVAVAIRYKEGSDNAPIMVAKGMNLMAEKIKDIARKNSVIITENPPLARALAKLDVGWEIPQELFQAVAEILAFVYQAKGKIKLDETPENVDNNMIGRDNYPKQGLAPKFTE